MKSRPGMIRIWGQKSWGHLIGLLIGSTNCAASHELNPHIVCIIYQPSDGVADGEYDWSEESLLPLLLPVPVVIVGMKFNFSKTTFLAPILFSGSSKGFDWETGAVLGEEAVDEEQMVPPPPLRH